MGEYQSLRRRGWDVEPSSSSSHPQGKRKRDDDDLEQEIIKQENTVDDIDMDRKNSD